MIDPRAPLPEPASLTTLRSTDRLYRALVERAPELIVLIEGRGNLAFVNGACERILGYSRAEMLGRELDEFLAPEGDLPAGWLHPRVPHRTPIRGRARAQRKDRSEIEVYVSLAPTDGEDGVPGSSVAVISELDKCASELGPRR